VETTDVFGALGGFQGDYQAEQGIHKPDFPTYYILSAGI